MERMVVKRIKRNTLMDCLHLQRLIAVTKSGLEEMIRADVDRAALKQNEI